MEAQLPIGVFDSGMGGLTVLRELMRQLPQEDFVYLGDTARLPYGTKSKETVRQYASLMTRYLHREGIKMLVVACNTATASALPYLKKEFPSLPIVGVISPGANAALSATKNNNILLLATETTINSKAYHESLLASEISMQIQSQACGLLVALAEEGCIDDAISAEVLKKYLTPFLGSCCDTVILGCTHFPVFRRQIANFFGEGVQVIDSAYETSQVVKRILAELFLNKSSSTKQSLKFYVTDLPERFLRVSKSFLDFEIDESSIELISDFSIDFSSSDNILAE